MQDHKRFGKYFNGFVDKVCALSLMISKGQPNHVIMSSYRNLAIARALALRTALASAHLVT